MDRPQTINEILARMERRLIRAYLRELASRPCCQTYLPHRPEGGGDTQRQQRTHEDGLLDAPAIEGAGFPLATSNSPKAAQHRGGTDPSASMRVISPSGVSGDPCRNRTGVLQADNLAPSPLSQRAGGGALPPQDIEPPRASGARMDSAENRKAPLATVGGEGESTVEGADTPGGQKRSRSRPIPGEEREGGH